MQINYIKLQDEKVIKCKGDEEHFVCYEIAGDKVRKLSDEEAEEIKRTLEEFDRDFEQMFEEFEAMMKDFEKMFKRL